MATNNANNIAVPTGVSSGGTGQVSLTNHGVLVGAAKGNITSLTVGSANSILMGNASADPSFTTSGTPYMSSISFDSGSNTISNYAVGTFTPTLIGGTVAGSTTYSSRNGYYTRIGNIVFVQATIVITAATGTGNVLLGGLPFTVKNQTNGYSAGNILWSGSTWPWPASRTYISYLANINSTAASCYAWGSGLTQTQMLMSNHAATVSYSATYQI